VQFFSSSFTGKEKDEETGYGYFGARYMDHELMTMWLSVDPMADKYPSISPYAYCTWNPVKLVDPDGMDTIVSINTKKPTRTRITGRGDLGTARKLHNRYVTNRNLVTYARMYYKDASDVVHVFMHGDPAHVELADERPLDAKALYLYIFSRSPQLQKNEIQDKASSRLRAINVVY
jgi:RHS repeat-associated protein